MASTVAVIITTYNSPKYLEMVLAGYEHQKCLPDEIIIADDGSGQATADIVAAWRSRLACPVQHVWHEDIGFRAAKIRNEAVKASKSDYLIFTDGDCVPHPCFVSDHLRLQKPGRFVQGKRMLVGRTASVEFSCGSFSRLLAFFLRGELSGCHHLLRLPGVSIAQSGLRGIKTCNLAVFRSDFTKVNGFNEDYVGWGREDADLAMRLMNSGIKRYDAPFSALVYHLWHEENSRLQLSANDQILTNTIATGATFCRNGLSKEKL